MQHIKVNQLYVRGLYKHGALLQLCEKAFARSKIDYAATLKLVS
jgi:hypothetical protein